MALPPKRQKIRSGIERGPQREWPRHRKHVRAHACSVPGCKGSDIACAHVRMNGAGGMALKPPDWLSISLCNSVHHAEQHAIGHIAFDKKYGIDSLALAAAFVRTSPDTEMKRVMAEWSEAA